MVQETLPETTVGENPNLEGIRKPKIDQELKARFIFGLVLIVFTFQFLLFVILKARHPVVDASHWESLRLNGAPKLEELFENRIEELAYTIQVKHLNEEAIYSSDDILLAWMEEKSQTNLVINQELKNPEFYTKAQELRSEFNATLTSEQKFLLKRAIHISQSEWLNKERAKR